MNKSSPPYTPSACIVMACRGYEARLADNIEAILTQDYENYRAIIVTDTTDDPAYPVAKTAVGRHPERDSQLLTSGSHPKASGKVSAMLTALEWDGGRSEVYAFVDSDALTTRRWLIGITAPLRDESVGATTGFRWYFPLKGGFWSSLQSAWNASGTNLMFNDRYNFPWGGAMAVRRDTLDKICITGVWETAVSDDLSLNAALRKHNYRIVFVPQCTVVTYTYATMGTLLKWATRQVALTKSFNSALWRYGGAAYTFFTIQNVLAVASLIAGLTLSPIWFLPAALLFVPFLLGVLRSHQRIQSFKRALPEFTSEFERIERPHSIASLIVPWIMTYCIFKSARMKEIEWRGRKYGLKG